MEKMGVELASHHQAIYPEVEEFDFSDSDLVYHVRSALKAALVGDCDSYNQIVAVICTDKNQGPEEMAMLVTCVKALSGAVSCLRKYHHDSLLDAIFKKSLWDYGTDVMDALLELVVSLATSNGEFIDGCLNMLVKNFMPPDTFLKLFEMPHGVARKHQVCDRLHSALECIAALVPLFPMRLEDKIIEQMPKIYKDEHVLVTYVENMLRLESGAIGEFVGSNMLVAIVDRLIDLDVEIPWEDILQDDFTAGICHMEFEDFEGLEVNGLQDGDELSREFLMQSLLGGNDIAKKLDSLLVLTFEHLVTCNESGRLVQVFETLLQSFQTTILTAHKSKFAQFVMFYACSLDPENCGRRFTSMLQHIFESSPYPEWRMSAVAYLASYLSRAKFASASFVASILGSLVNWCSEYCKNHDADINPKAHRIFYAGCQAMMYVLCFRMRSMLLVPRLKSQLLLMRIEDILRHPLNPLKVCLPSIVEEFLWLVNTTQLFTLPEIMESGGQLESELSRAFGGVERLDMFFPFDPCLLKKSDRFIRPNYLYWSMVRSTYDEDDDDRSTSDDEDVAEAHGLENGMDIPDGPHRKSYDEHDSVLDDFDYSLEKMSITPEISTLSHQIGNHNRMLMPARIRPSTSPNSF